MPAPTRSGARPRGGRRAVGLAVACVLVVAGPVAQSLVLAGAVPPPCVALLRLFGGLGPVVSLLVLAHRAWTPGTVGTEGTVWRWSALAALAVVGAGVADDVAPLLGERLPPAATHLGGLVGACLLYQGLLRWNRYRGPATGPGDWLNGAGAVLCATALVTTGLAEAGVEASGDLLEDQLWLLSLVSGLMVLGTLPTVALIAGLRGDARLWALVTAAALAVCAVAVDPFTDPPGAGTARAGWTLLVAFVALVSLVRPGEHTPRPATAQASAVGAIFVLALSVAVLVLSPGLLEEGVSVTTAYAVLAIAGVVVRLVRLLRELGQVSVRRQEAVTDELTGVENRRGLARRLDHAAGQEMALLAVDLDRFKLVNDRYGHATGDALLQHVAARLRASLPRDAHLARSGGDEFAVVLGPASARRAAVVAERVVAEVTRPVVREGVSFGVGASVGLATVGDEAVPGDELMRRADVAMYAAKAGGGGVVQHTSALDDATRHRTALLHDLRDVLDHRGAGVARGGQVAVHHQVQLDRDGRPVGVEALVRWQHPVHGLLQPDRFIALAEEHGLMVRLTDLVLEAALRDATVLRRAGWALQASVNLSTTCLADPALPDTVDAALRRWGLPPSALVLEVTETTFMADPRLAVRTAAGLTARGVEVSIDDYGTGYSSLTYLADLPVAELKLDRAFAARMVDRRTRAIVAGSVDLAHRLGLRVVAEGVEDEATLTALRDAGCDRTQGYLHGRPVPLGELLVALGTPVPPAPSGSSGSSGRPPLQRRGGAGRTTATAGDVTAPPTAP